MRELSGNGRGFYQKRGVRSIGGRLVSCVGVGKKAEDAVTSVIPKEQSRIWKRSDVQEDDMSTQRSRLR